MNRDYYYFSCNETRQRCYIKSRHVHEKCPPKSTHILLQVSSKLMLVNRMYSVNYLIVRYWEKNEKTAEDRIGSKRARIPSILSIAIHSVI